MAALPRVLGTDDLPLAELGAARLDGELFAFGRGWCPPDVPGTPLDRAAAATLGRPTRWIAELTTAAWIWGALDVEPHPARFRCAHDDSDRCDRDVVVRRAETYAREWTVLGTARVTSPLRTLLDLARRREGWEENRAVVLRLVEERRLTADVVRGAAERERPTPHGALAASRLAGLYPAFTRYTS